jgi:hypothetical protein
VKTAGFIGVMNVPPLGFARGRSSDKTSRLVLVDRADLGRNLFNDTGCAPVQETAMRRRGHRLLSKLP